MLDLTRIDKEFVDAVIEARVANPGHELANKPINTLTADQLVVMVGLWEGGLTVEKALRVVRQADAAYYDPTAPEHDQPGDYFTATFPSVQVTKDTRREIAQVVDEWSNRLSDLYNETDYARFPCTNEDTDGLPEVSVQRLGPDGPVDLSQDDLLGWLAHEQVDE